MTGKKPNNEGNTSTQGQTNTAPTNSSSTTTPDGVAAVNPVDTKAPTTTKVVDMTGAKAVVPGANPITKDNKVATPEGKIALNNLRPMDDGAPKQTGLLDKAAIPAGVIKINIGNNKFTPNEFTVKANQPVSFSLSATDSYTHVIVFDSSDLSAVAMLVGMGQTKAITFNAPATPGVYTFRCDSPDHASKGETGRMIVK